MTLTKAKELFLTALAEFAPDWSFDNPSAPGNFAEVGSGPQDWIEYGSAQSFGTTLVKDNTRRVLGRRKGGKSNEPFSYEPAVPGDFLEQYHAGDDSNIRRFIVTHVTKGG